LRYCQQPLASPARARFVSDFRRIVDSVKRIQKYDSQSWDYFLNYSSELKQEDYMGQSNRNTKNKKATIQCIEVLIPKSFIVKSGHNLHWTLSVYSLENHPVTKNRSIHNSEIFHFMVYDWNRTIKELLENLKIPYSIIQYFSPDSIYADSVQTSDKLLLPDSERELFEALESLSDGCDEAHDLTLEVVSKRAETAAMVLEKAHSES